MVGKSPLKCTKMIEKVTLNSISSEIQRLVGIKYDSFELEPSQEIDTGWNVIGGYGLYMLYSGDIGLSAIYVIGSYENGLIGFNGYNTVENICGNMGSGAQLEFGVKQSNGNLFIKNNRGSKTTIRVKRYLEYNA